MSLERVAIFVDAGYLYATGSENKPASGRNRISKALRDGITIRRYTD